MKHRKAAVIAGALLMATAGLASAETTLKIGLAEDPDVLDPTLARTFVGRIVFASLCDKLFDITADLKIVPQLATGYQWVDDNKGLVITLRQGVTFHDGERMDAAAVKYSLDRHLTLPGSNRKGEIGAVQSVDVVDDHTVKLSLKAPFSPLLAPLTDRAGMIVSPKAAEAAKDKFGSAPVCAGPYKFVERVAQDRIVVQKFDNYWDKDKIHVDKIVFQPIPDNSVRIANLRSGGLDFIERVAPTDLTQLRADNALQIASMGELGYQGITINVNNGAKAKNPLGQDARVRQAFSLAIDRDALNQVVFNGEFIPGDQWVPPESPYYDKALPVPKRDVAKAKALLKEAGVEHPSFTLMMPNNTEPQQVNQVVQSMAAEAGFDIKLQATEFATSLDLAEKGEMEAFQIGWSGRTDPDGNIFNFVTCKAPVGFNNGLYCNDQVDKELTSARTVSDLEDRKKHYAAAAELLLKDLPVIYLYHRKWIYAFNKKVAGFTPYPDGLIRPQGLTMQ
ncbi:MAG TPA: ABC transporter substrate-binding protein [Stellaceae bacterium]|nr:ABC transporter substrate-binding protein [Stellaceae bacterium]